VKVLAAMSGGVDSAVAAARAVDAGHDVVGVHLALAQAPAALRAGSRGCCSREDAGDARRAADVLGIPFYVWDFAARFAADVVDDFVAAYAAGQTPNPCLRCNEKIKFAALLDRALALGFDAVCTGHYAGSPRRAAQGRRRREGPVLRPVPHGRAIGTRCSCSATRPGRRPAEKPRAACGWPPPDEE
jgi:tRNA U34 2-thiouridine synthase MnmA/TrmU